MTDKTDKDELPVQLYVGKGLDTYDASNINAQEASEAELTLYTRANNCVDWCDLMVDEFARIKAILNRDDSTQSREIVGICERAVTNTKQRIPVIEQRDRLELLQKKLDGGYILFGLEGYSPEFYEIVERTQPTENTTTEALE